MPRHERLEAACWWAKSAANFGLPMASLVAFAQVNGLQSVSGLLDSYLANRGRSGRLHSQGSWS
jgi:hypothetical protein